MRSQRRSIAVLFVLVGIGFLPGCRDGCQNTISERSVSPDGRLAVVNYTRGCGAAGGLSRQVSILPARDWEPSGIGNVFVAENERKISAEWRGSDTLVITHSSSIVQQRFDIEGVRVVYKSGNIP
jgi:hypothetical protein